MEDAEFNKRIKALLISLNELPDSEFKEKLKAQAKHVIENRMGGQRALSSFQESLGLLRVHMKYVMFDLEATRRENEQLKERLRKYDEGSSED